MGFRFHGYLHAATIQAPLYNKNISHCKSKIRESSNCYNAKDRISCHHNQIHKRIMRIWKKKKNPENALVHIYTHTNTDLFIPVTKYCIKACVCEQAKRDSSVPENKCETWKLISCIKITFLVLQFYMNIYGLPNKLTTCPVSIYNWHHLLIFVSNDAQF